MLNKTSCSARPRSHSDKQAWLDGVSTIDSLDSAASVVADHLHAGSLRDTAIESSAWAQVHLPNLGSLTAQPTAAHIEAT